MVVVVKTVIAVAVKKEDRRTRRRKEVEIMVTFEAVKKIKKVKYEQKNEDDLEKEDIMSY